MTVEKLFNNLWNNYTNITPQANEIHNLFQKTQNKRIINDHIAIRTLNNKKCNINAISKILIELGYIKKDYYEFKEKKLDAYYFLHDNKNYAKIFISELKLECFCKEVQDILNNIINKIPNKILNSNTLLYSSRHWDINYKTYKYLYTNSPYAAWFYIFGYMANHFTIFVNDLENFTTLSQVNDFILKNNYALNSSGGLIKGSAEELLEQSSTLAYEISIEFTDGVYKIPSCFYEFAKRYTDKNNKLYNGFIASSANKIFESTN